MNTMLIRQIRVTIPVLLYSLTSSIHYPWTIANLDYFRSSDIGPTFSDTEISIITSSMHFGRLVSAIAEIFLLKKYGRKMHFISSASLMLISLPFFFVLETVVALSAVRFVTGFSIGMGDMGMHTYVGETVSKKFRGAFITTTSIVFCVGVMLTYAAPIFLEYNYILLCALAINTVFFFCSFDLIESPHFLVINGQTEKAMNNLKWLNDYTPKEAENELKVMIEHTDKIMSVFDLIRNFHKPDIYKSFSIVVSLGVIMTILATVTTCFANLVFPKADSISSSTFAIGFTALIMLVTCSASLVVDRYGRRVLLLGGFALQTIAQASIALLYYLRDNCAIEISNFPELMFGFITITFLAFQFACMVPYGAVRGEIFSTSFKTIGIGANIIFNSLSNTIFSYFFLPIMETYGIYFNFLIFSVSCLIGVLIVFTLLPETKKRSLIEIQIMLRKG